MNEKTLASAAEELVKKPIFTPKRLAFVAVTVVVAVGVGAYLKRRKDADDEVEEIPFAEPKKK